jgi:phage replication O-like protein O
MADVQAENGYTRIANELLEAITRYKFNGTQLKIVMAVIRYTYGFSRKDAELSLVYLSKATGVDKRNLRREINVLIADKVLTVTKEATFTQSRMFRINKDYEEWKLNDPQWEVLPTGGEITLTPEGELTHSPEGEITHSPGGELTPQERKINKALKKDINKDIVECIVNHLNSRCGTNFEPTTKKTIDFINARIKEGYKLEDFKTVINKKADEWENTNMRTYLRPITLFGTKFESYLNQLNGKSKKQETKNENFIEAIAEVYNEQEGNWFVIGEDQGLLPSINERDE